MRVYYNEFDKKKCAALKALMDDGFIRKGDIDDRSIRDVQPDDVKGYDRAHFFAGIGLWDYALDLARWQDDQPVWTGSCPCQPFSSAGRQKGKGDDRHLWPEWQRLIEQCRPATVFGEQVARAVTHGWLDDVYQGLEAQGYACGAAVLPACGVGAPHRRDRLWFVGDAEYDGSYGGQIKRGDGQAIFDYAKGKNSTGKLERAGQSGNVADTKGILSQRRKDGQGEGEFGGNSKFNGAMGNADRFGSSGQGQLQRPMYSAAVEERETDQPFNDGSRHWKNGQWIDCPDGKQRLVEPRISLLAHGYPERVGVIHCAGDAIVPQVAAEFIKTYMEALK